jgi:hypothetical protein
VHVSYYNEVSHKLELAQLGHPAGQLIFALGCLSGLGVGPYFAVKGLNFFRYFAGKGAKFRENFAEISKFR